MDALPANWIDLAMLAVLVLSALVGLWRGFTFETLSLAGLFVAYFAARWLEPEIAPQLPIGEPGSMLNRGLAFAVAFLLVLVVWSLFARVVARLIAATPLKPIDRLLGAVFGLARGVLVLLVVATLVAYSPAARSEAWRESVGAVWLNALLRALLPLVPAQAAPWLPQA